MQVPQDIDVSYFPLFSLTTFLSKFSTLESHNSHLIKQNELQNNACKSEGVDFEGSYWKLTCALLTMS
jgi:hypothetical protein